MSETRDREWREIEREAREQNSLDVIRLESTPLEFGQHIAWTTCLLACTNGISELHRVGHPILGYDHTTCGDVIPPPVRWLPLSPAIIRTLPRCKYCEAEHVRILTERAA